MRFMLFSSIFYSFLFSQDPISHELETTKHDIVFIIFVSILLIFAGLLFRNNLFLSKQKNKSDKEKQKFQTLLEYASDGVHIIDTNGNIYDCSKSFYRPLGYYNEDILKENITNIDENMSMESLENLFTKLLDKPYTYTTRYKKNDNTFIDVEVNTKLMMIENETYIYASARDITQRLALKQELQYERDFLDTLFDNAEAIVATINLDGVMTKVNKYTEDLTGYTKKEISSKPYFWFEKFIPSDIQPDIKSIIFSLIKDGNVVAKKENEWIIKDGSKRMFEWSNKVIYEDSKPKYLLTMGIDITDRKRYELELQDLNENLEQKIHEATKKLNHSLEIIEKNVIGSKTDLNGVITEVTDRFCEISKYTREELIGKNHNIVRHEDMPDNIYKELWDTIKSGQTWHGIIKNKNKDGNSYWVDSIISPLYDENNVHIGYFSHRIDITQEILNREIQEKHNKELESKVKSQIEEIRQKDVKMLEQAKLASIGELLTNIAHHWRQPLSVISVCSTGVRYGLEFGGLSNEEILEQLNSINESCDYLSNTIESFDKYLNASDKFDYYDVFAEVKSAKFIVESSLKANLIEFIDELDYSKNYKVYMIENSLSQVLINLITNSEEAFENRKIEDKKWIKLSSKQTDESLILSIEDNAGGIPEDTINRIFEPYFTTKFKSKGTGLGLSLSYSIIVEDIKGDIQVENTLEGAKFIIEVPIE